MESKTQAIRDRAGARGTGVSGPIRQEQYRRAIGEPKAIGGLTVGVEEGGAARGEVVEVGGLRQWMPAHVADPVVLIINGDEQNIRFGSDAGQDQGKREKNKQELQLYEQQGILGGARMSTGLPEDGRRKSDRKRLTGRLRGIVSLPFQHKKAKDSTVHPLLQKISEETKRKDLTPFKVGDVVDIGVKIKEGDKERVQNFTGTVIARDGYGSTETFTVRRISFGTGVERIFPVHSPYISSIKVTREGKAKRAKLYYVRDLIGKAAKAGAN